MPKRLPYKIGEKVKVVQIPKELHDAAKIGTPALFRRILGKTFSVEGFDRYGHVELKATKRDSIWIEPEFLVHVRSKAKSK
jgi:hypothetical protein